MTKAFRDWLQAAREASGRGAAAGGLASAHAAIADRKRRRVVGDLCELAGLYVELLQDSEQARSCLDEALDLADNVGDLVTLAGAHAEQPGGKRIAGGLVDRALELARLVKMCAPY